MFNFLEYILKNPTDQEYDVFIYGYDEKHKKTDCLHPKSKFAKVGEE